MKSTETTTCVKVYCKETKEIIDVIDGITKACRLVGVDSRNIKDKMRNKGVINSSLYNRKVIVGDANPNCLNKDWLIEQITALPINSWDKSKLYSFNIIKLNNILKDSKKAYLESKLSKDGINRNLR